MSERKILILGASARAAAMSARRAGLLPLAADLFADADLQAISPTVRVTDYPGQLREAASQFPCCPWLYTGALENYPELVDEISTERPLLGNGAAVLRGVRDPFQVAAALRAWRLPAARLQSEPPRRGRWLAKPYRSAGGAQVLVHDPDNDDRRRPGGRPVYFQQRLAGQPIAAVYVAAAGRAQLLGVTRQLIGTPWLFASEFAYAGSLGPIQLNQRAATQLQQIGHCLARQFGLRGLFGVDLIWHEEQVWVVEVNPRYTASVEVLERSLAITALPLHMRACVQDQLPGDVPHQAHFVSGKAIRFCAQPFTMSRAAVQFAMQRHHADQWPIFADIPRAGIALSQGQPLATALARGANEGEVALQLRMLWESFDRQGI